MALVRKLLRLPPAERSLLIASTFVVGVIRLGAWVLPYRLLRQCVAVLARRRAGPPGADRPSVAAVVRAVNVASRHVPGSRGCLIRALATRAILIRQGHDAALRIGVARSEEGDFQAHAWVENEGRIVIGRVRNLGRYRTLQPVRGAWL